MKNSASRKLRYLTLSAMFAAVVYVLTSLQLFKGLLPNGGYVHIGDAAIFMAASILPSPYAVCAGVVGASLADILSGSVGWVPATVVIKAVMALLVSSKSESVLAKRNVGMSLAASAFCAAGYLAYELMIYGPGSAFATLISFLWLVQLIGSWAVFMGFGYAMDKVKIKGTVLRKI